MEKMESGTEDQIKNLMYLKCLIDIKNDTTTATNRTPYPTVSNTKPLLIQRECTPSEAYFCSRI
jgi:hypothetical protein